jgi:hypothetical protein
MATQPTSLVKYGAFELTDAEEESRLGEDEGGVSEFLKLAQGKNVLRFLPPKPGVKPFKIIYEHFIETPGQKGRMRFCCPRLMAQCNCPACNEMNELRKTGNPVDRNKAWSLKGKRRVYANVIDRAHEDEGVKVFAFGKMIHEALLTIRQDASDGGDFTNPTAEGFDIVIMRKGEALDTEYSVLAARNASPLSAHPRQMEDWIADQFDLDSYARVPDEEELARMFSGQSTRKASPSGNEKTERKPRNVTPPTSRRRTAADDMGDDDIKV